MLQQVLAEQALTMADDRHLTAYSYKEGFAEVYNLSGGVLAWQNANLPLTRKKRG
jgi:rhodanese-related sulfurtransferase